MNPTPREESKGPLVSVITVCLNAERHLRTAMDSVLNQSYEHIEYIVIDGGSKDGTLSIIRDYEQRFAGRMRWISEPDEGLYDAMNKGVSMAAGTLIGILNADDFYEPDAVEQVVDTWSTHPEAGVVYGDTTNVDKEGNRVTDRVAPEVVTMDSMMQGMMICHQSMFVQSGTYSRIGMYDTRYRILADYEFVLRCIEHGVQFAYTGSSLSGFRIGGVSGQSARQFDLEFTRISIAFGANPVARWALYYKHILATTIYNSLQRIAGLSKRSH